MATLDAIVKLGVDNPINGMKYQPGHAVRKGMEFQDEARKVANDWRLKRDEINGNADLTDEGKRRAWLKHGKEAVEKLATFNKVLEYIRRDRDSIATTLTFGGGKPPTVEEVYREREYRDRLYALDASQRHIIFEKAVEQGDDLTLKAFFNAPSFAPLINDKLAAMGKQMLVQRRNPEAAAELADLEFAHSALSENYNDIAAGIKKEAGIVEERPRYDAQSAA